MNKFTLKYYPPKILISLIGLFIALIFAYKELVNTIMKKEAQSEITDLLCIVASAGTTRSLLYWVNQHLMRKWWLKLLGLKLLWLYDIRGTYTGIAISSFHKDDDPSKPNIKLYCKMEVTQNLNGFHITGRFYTDKKMTQQSSDFFSFSEEMEKSLNGTLNIHYFFSNKGNQLHPSHNKYGLNNHDGVCVLNYDPKAKQMEGYYFNHERASHGKLTLELSK